MPAVGINGGSGFALHGVDVAVDAAQISAQVSVGVGRCAAVRVVRVLMVAQVLGLGAARLMFAVRRHRRPTELERKQREKNNGEKAAHAASLAALAWGPMLAVPPL